MSAQTYDTDTTAAEQLIARVLGREHRLAESVEDPADARVVLQVAHSFADEFASADPDFDRERFIHTVMDRQS